MREGSERQRQRADTLGVARATLRRWGGTEARGCRRRGGLFREPSGNGASSGQLPRNGFGGTEPVSGFIMLERCRLRLTTLGHLLGNTMHPATPGVYIFRIDTRYGSTRENLFKNFLNPRILFLY